MNHAIAKTKFAALVASGVPLTTHNYVLVEALALLQRRLGMESAARFESDSRRLNVEWVSTEMHVEAARRWKLGVRDVSFVDQVSFLMMQLREITTAFAFDDDFEKAGFRLY